MASSSGNTADAAAQKSWYALTVEDESEQNNNNNSGSSSSQPLEQSVEKMTVSDQAPASSSDGSGGSGSTSFGLAGKFTPFGAQLKDYGATDIERMQADPNNPLYSEVESFEELNLYVPLFSECLSIILRFV